MVKLVVKSAQLAMNTLVRRQTLQDQIGDLGLVPLVLPHRVEIVSILHKLASDGLDIQRLRVEKRHLVVLQLLASLILVLSLHRSELTH